MIIEVRVTTRIQAVARNAYGYRVVNLLEKAAKVIVIEAAGDGTINLSYISPYSSLLNLQVC